MSRRSHRVAINLDTKGLKELSEDDLKAILRGADEAELSPDNDEQDRVLKLLMDELPLKQAAALAAKVTGGQKNALYQRALALKE